MASEADLRQERLAKYLTGVLHGRHHVSNHTDAGKFLEALYKHPDRLLCIERLMASMDGQSAFRAALRMELSPIFLDKHVSAMLDYLDDPALRHACSGVYMKRLLLLIADPPTFFNEYYNLVKGKSVSEETTASFAWLLHELLQTVDRDTLEVKLLGIAKEVTEANLLTKSSLHRCRTFGYKIQKIWSLQFHALKNREASSAGGRHDNDFADYRKICILPTPDELLSQDAPFYREADHIFQVDIDGRPTMHLDNQFRLLREEMLSELRLDIQAVTGQSKLKRRHMARVQRLQLEGPYFEDGKKKRPFALQFAVIGGIPELVGIEKETDRLQHLNDNRQLLRQQSFGCLLRQGAMVAFATLVRIEELLAKSDPSIVLEVSDIGAVEKLLIKAKLREPFDFILVDTPIFAFAPILEQLQQKTGFTMADAILGFDSKVGVTKSPLALNQIAQRIQSTAGRSLESVMSLPEGKVVALDPSQCRSLVTALSKSFSLIQGPPGTGKSFIGALVAKAIFDTTSEHILILCYTNHALDQFLEDLMDIGIPKESMVRLGAKSTPRTEDLNLFQQKGGTRLTRENWTLIDLLRCRLDQIEEDLNSRVDRLLKHHITERDMLQYLEFVEDDPNLPGALTVPHDSSGMQRVGARGKAVDSCYLIRQWRHGLDAGIFHSEVGSTYPAFWTMTMPARKKLEADWRLSILKEQTSIIGRLIKEYNETQKERESVMKIPTHALLQTKRIIGCTTTAAAKYTSELSSAAPGVIIVEEAGEILESHILTAIVGSTRHICLIGDHKQLRPKVNNFDLTVERGTGFNLNVSLFERLVLQGFPCETLTKQHRMPPEISALVRLLTYPDLEDSENTSGRERLRGIQDRVVFVNHEQPEDDQGRVADRRDGGSKTSKQNEFEADMVLRTVRHLGHQGYGTDKIVVLTPYLGQLSLLRKKLSKENDPVLNDLDSFDLARAGLITPAVAASSKRRIKISTIDNYQGEESDIVVVSLTRSNPRGDIGFMSAPQRINVLLSRARIGLIILGNASTLLKGRKSNDTWKPLLEHLKSKNQYFDGLPVKCERHPSTEAILRCKEDFDLYCPEGGCSKPCEVLLSCGQHLCPQRCHQLYDHSKMDCLAPINHTCSQGHKRSLTCSKAKLYTCLQCADEIKQRQHRQERELALDATRAEKQRQHARRLAAIKDELDHEKRLAREKREDDERSLALARATSDLAAFRMRLQSDVKAAKSQGVEEQNESSHTSELHVSASTTATLEDEQNTPKDHIACASEQNNSSNTSTLSTSKAADDWNFRKSKEGEACDALDELMGMIGLEDVKMQFLSIKDEIDLATRQDIDLSNKRLGASLLGNPGTGKTTVARLYARFLASVGALPGDHIEETTGSRLASDGIVGCKKLIETMLNKGGGALFIDEAYQLTSGHNFGGGAILDFLLGEVENLRGKVVFILAGYNKEMESFFSHNPGLPSRFPQTFQFQDYSDEELLRIMESRLENRYRGKVKMAGGPRGLYARIASKRVGRSRGREGFGNARAVENVVEQMASRQAKRIQQQRRTAQGADDLVLTQGDIIGPEPSGILKTSAAWKSIQQMIGIHEVKRSIEALLQSVELNYTRELEEQPIFEFSLNKVFIGSPGTGKTSVAKLYGQVLAELGLLSNGQVVVKQPADFIGAVLGESEKNTKAILASTAGKVLVIDEAYGLCSTNNGGKDPYKTAVIDTLVAEIQSTPGEDRCVLLLGYRDEMQAMFQDVNPGLSRRFPLDSAFDFADFTNAELRQILDLKLRQQGLQVTNEAKDVAMEVLDRARNRPNFGNAGEVDILLDKAKSRYQRRLTTNGRNSVSKFQPQDFDEEFDRGSRATTNLQMLFAGVIGCDDIVRRLQGFQETVAKLKARNIDAREHIPFNFLFRGPPGTGKTTTAKKMGKVYYDMGLLSTAEVLEHSSTDLVGQYVGQTAPKTVKLFEKALGKVLFIDEAYRLAEGQFAKEAMDEIVDCLTKPKFENRLVVILAGYDHEINSLMAINPGLSSRFPETISFKHLDPDACLRLLTHLLVKQSQLDTTALTSLSEERHRELVNRFRTLLQTDGWANARDVKTVAKEIFGIALKATKDANSTIVVHEDALFEGVDIMIKERLHRSNHLNQQHHHHQRKALDQTQEQVLSFTDTPPIPERLGETTSTLEASLANDGPPTHVEECGRDDNVSDTVWHQLQLDKAAADARCAAAAKIAEEEEKNRTDLEKASKEEQLISLKLSNAADNEEKRRIESERLRNEMERRALEEEAEKIAKRKEHAARERKKEAAVQSKLRKMGVCVAGFRWIRQASGYRCQGGFHFVSNSELGSTA